MGIVNATTLYDGNFDFTKATATDVQFAFIITMPFRFRVGNPYRCRFENRGAHYDIWIKNNPLPTSEAGIPLHGLMRAGGRLEDLWSRVVLIPNKSIVTDSELEALRRCSGNVDATPFESRNRQLFTAIQALNAFTVGYHTARRARRLRHKRSGIEVALGSDWRGQELGRQLYQGIWLLVMQQADALSLHGFP